MLETMTMRTTPALPRSGNETEVALLSTLLARALDEVDFGILLLAEDGEVLHMNHRARLALQADKGLQVLGNRLRTSDRGVRCSIDLAARRQRVPRGSSVNPER